MLVELHGTPEWEQALVDNGWTDAFATGVEFEEFLVEQNERVETTLEELGTRMSATKEQPPTPAARVTIDRAQYGLAAFLAVVGGYVIYDASGLEPGFADDPLGQKAFPYAVGAALLVLGVLLTVATMRGDTPQSEEGEDVDLTQGADWFTVAKLIGVFAVNIVLVDFLGWAITGAILFAGCAGVLGSTTHLRNIAIGAALSVSTWYGFYVGLGVPIPPGILDGVL